MYFPLLALGLLRLSAPEPEPRPDLPAMLRQFFIGESEPVRQQARQAILAPADLDVKQLESAIRAIDLWSHLPPPENPLRISLGAANPAELEVFVRLPADYDPKRAWPLLILLHGQNARAQSVLHHAADWLGEAVREFVIAAPQDLDGPGFSLPADQELRPRRLLVELRKRFHIDSDRVFIGGYSLGGHRTWLSAILHADCFAGAMPLAGTLIIPGTEVLIPDFLQNLRYTAFVCAWGQTDFGEENGKLVPGTGIAAGNQRVVKGAREIGMNDLVLVELPGVGHAGVAAPPEARSRWVQARRPRFPAQVRLAFRLAETASAWWVRADALIGPPLDPNRIVAPVKPGEDPAVAMAEFLRKNIGIIDARLDGRTIALTTQKCKHVHLLLHDDLIDLDQPLIVTRNNRRVFDGKVTRSPGVMLDEAAREWDFQRLYSARLVVPVSGRARMAGADGSVPRR